MLNMIFKRYICLICGLIYDELKGWPDAGIKAKTKWNNVSMLCPNCGVTKEEFKEIKDGYYE